METKTPVEIVYAAAALYAKRGREATPGQWRRPLNIRNKDAVYGNMSPDEAGPHGRYKTHIDPATGRRREVVVAFCHTDSSGHHMRQRGGRDLEWIALANPAIAEPLAAMLRAAAARAARYNDPHVQAILIGQEALTIAYAAMNTPEADQIMPQEEWDR